MSAPTIRPAHDSVFLESTRSICPVCRAVAEMRRVLRPGGVVAIADVTADPEDLPVPLRGVAAHIACLAEALPGDGYEAMLHDARFELIAVEPHDDVLAELAERVEYRLRAARILDAASEIPRHARRNDRPFPPRQGAR